jgi:hypothetical protein
MYTCDLARKRSECIRLAVMASKKQKRADLAVSVLSRHRLAFTADYA